MSTSPSTLGGQVELTAEQVREAFHDYLVKRSIYTTRVTSACEAVRSYAEIGTIVVKFESDRPKVHTVRFTEVPS